jgi:RNA polymerase sigma factor (sigma-70 family)
MQQVEQSAAARPSPRAPASHDSVGGATDHELLEACRRGDSLAWDTLVGRYERLIFSVAMRNGLGREDAADVTQTTFIALLDSIGQLRDEERLPYWLMTVARRQAWRVRNRRRDEVCAATVDGIAVDPIPDIESVAVVHEGLARLGGPCKDLLVALYFDPSEPSYEQIAVRMARPIGSVGPMRARCLQKLRRILGEEDAS